MKTIIKKLWLFFPLFILSSPPNFANESETWKLYDDSKVAIVEIVVNQNSLTWLYNDVENDSLLLAKVHFKNFLIDETVDSVGFRLRGNTSRHSQKKSFKLSFNEFVRGRQFYGVDELNLNGEHNDPSIVRSKLCWDFFRDIGLIASRAAHAAVYINGEYYGLYISVEHIDDEFLQNSFADDSGNLWKCLYPADLTFRGTNPESYFPYFDDVRPYELKTNEDKYDFRQLARFIRIINKTSDALFPDSLEQILVVPEVLKYFALNVLTGSWDDYWFLMNNYYLYHEPAINKFHWIPYDYDNSFGIDWFNVDWATVNPYLFANFEVTQGRAKGARPLVERIMENAQYRNLYSHFLEFFIENVYSLSIWESQLNDLKQKITPWAQLDTYRTKDWGFSINDFYQSYEADNYSNQHVKYSIKEFVSRRISSLQNQITYLNANPCVYNLDWQPKNAGANDSIRVTASVFSHLGMKEVLIQFQSESQGYGNLYSMFPNPISHTKLVEEADRWTGTIPPLGAGASGQFILIAKDLRGAIQIFPRTASVKIHTPPPVNVQVVINEFMADNANSLVDAAGEFDDWIELYNPTSEDIFLSGMYLTDKPDNLTKWQFPFGGVAIAAQGFLLIWCDEDQNQPGIHTNFKLSAVGEYLALVANDGITIVDSLSFDPQTADISYGRNPDGASNWQFFSIATPGAANIVSAVNTGNAAPHKYQLFQNYPNPFNAQTTIDFYLPKAAHVKVSVTNIAGQLIKELINEKRDAGYHSVQWNAKNNFSGLYFYKIEDDGYSAVRKCVLIK